MACVFKSILFLWIVRETITELIQITLLLEEKNDSDFNRIKEIMNYIDSQSYVYTQLLHIMINYHVLGYLCPGHLVAGTYSVTHVRNSEIKQLRPLFFAMFWDIDLIFGMWVYNDQLHIKFIFHSSSMIFGRVLALGLWNLAKYLVVTTLFHYDLRYWLDFWYESV